MGRGGSVIRRIDAVVGGLVFETLDHGFGVEVRSADDVESVEEKSDDEDGDNVGGTGARSLSVPKFHYYILQDIYFFD